MSTGSVNEGEAEVTPRATPTVIMLRPVGSSLPLGFLALAIATFSFAVLQLDWIAKNQGHTVALTVLLSTVPLQAIVSVLAFAARDTAPATAMGLLSGTWAAICVATLTSPPGGFSEGLGTFLVAAGVCLLVPAVAALPRPWPPIVIGMSGLRFVVTGVAQLEGSTTWLRVAGWVGLVLALVSFAAAVVLVVQRSTVGGSPQLQDEPGVRAGT
jgi:succinate-acetate transporter protein